MRGQLSAAQEAIGRVSGPVCRPGAGCFKISSVGVEVVVRRGVREEKKHRTKTSSNYCICCICFLSIVGILINKAVVLIKFIIVFLSLNFEL